MPTRFRDFLRRLIDVGALQQLGEAPRPTVAQARRLLRQAGRLARATKPGSHQPKTSTLIAA